MQYARKATLQVWDQIRSKRTEPRQIRQKLESVATKFQKDKVKGLPSPENELVTHAKETRDIEKAVDKLQEAIMLACNNSFKTAENIPKWTNYKSVTWWTQKLIIKRKRLNAVRTCYQTTHTTELLKDRRKICHDEKSMYQAAIKREKLNSWKEYCNLTH